MHTYWLLGPTPKYLSLLEAARSRAVTISNLCTENMEEPLTRPSSNATSTSLKVPEVKFNNGDHGNTTSPLTRASSPTKNNVLNKTKANQSTCPFSGANLF